MLVNLMNYQKPFKTTLGVLSPLLFSIHIIRINAFSILKSEMFKLSKDSSNHYAMGRLIGIPTRCKSIDLFLSFMI